MIERTYEFSDPRKMVTASKAQLREKCRALSAAEMKYDSFLVFPADELKVSTLKFSDLPTWWNLVHLYLRMYAWSKSEIRCRVGPAELEAFWEFMNLKDAEPEESEKEQLLTAVTDAALWERDEEGALWCYSLCRDYLSRSWLTATEVVNSLSEVIDEDRADRMDPV